MEIKKINEGSGPLVPKGAFVKVHYTGKLKDGKVFDSSVKRGEPLEFQVGVGRVIRGWDEGICQLRKGQKATLTCPPDYAYGADGAGSAIPPNATLTFDVEVVSFREGEPTSWVTCCFQFAILLAAVLFFFDAVLAPSKHYQPARPRLMQPELSLAADMDEKSRLLLDPETGVLQHQGWQVNGQKHVIDNSDTAAQSLFGKGNQHLNYLRKRGLDGVFLKTNDHWMELFFPVDLGVAAINKISVFDLDRGPRTKRVHELQNVYPEVRDDGDILLSDGKYLGMSFNLQPSGPDFRAMQVRSDELQLELVATMPGTYESHYWVQPLSDEKQHYFQTWKTAAIPLHEFSYGYGGKEFHCGKNECLLTTDQYRTHPDYGMAFWFFTASTVTADGRTVGIVLTDGIGSSYTGQDRASEDHVNLDGKVHKLDQSGAEFDADNLMNPVRLNTAGFQNAERRFANSCSLIYSPAYKDKDGVNLFLLAVVRDVTYGRATGHCIIDGEQVAIEGAYGFFETVYTRY